MKTKAKALKTNKGHAKMVSLVGPVKPSSSFYPTARTFKQQCETLGLSCVGVVKSAIEVLVAKLAGVSRQQPVTVLEVKVQVVVTYADGTVETIG